MFDGEGQRPRPADAPSALEQIGLRMRGEPSVRSRKTVRHYGEPTAVRSRKTVLITGTDGGKRMERV